MGRLSKDAVAGAEAGDFAAHGFDLHDAGIAGGLGIDLAAVIVHVAAALRTGGDHGIKCASEDLVGRGCGGHCGADKFGAAHSRENDGQVFFQVNAFFL